MSDFESICIILGESTSFGDRKVFENLPHLPHLPRSKLNEKRLSFEVCGSLVDLNLPRFCRICRVCPRRDRIRDEPEALQYPASCAF